MEALAPGQRLKEVATKDVVYQGCSVVYSDDVGLVIEVERTICFEEEGGDCEAYTYAPAPGELHDELIDLARRAVLAVEGTGYARVDIRYDSDPGVPYVLEVNANCGITGEVSSAVGSILYHSGATIDSFIDTIVADAWQRHEHHDGRRRVRVSSS